MAVERRTDVGPCWRTIDCGGRRYRGEACKGILTASADSHVVDQRELLLPFSVQLHSRGSALLRADSYILATPSLYIEKNRGYGKNENTRTNAREVEKERDQRGSINLDSHDRR